jgi:hypothetical protein
MQPPAGLDQAGEGAAVTAELTFTQGSRTCPDSSPTSYRSPLLSLLVVTTILIDLQGEQAAMQGLGADLESLPPETRNEQTAFIAKLARWLRTVTRELEERERKGRAAAATTLQGRIEAARKATRREILDVINSFVSEVKSTKKQQERQQLIHDGWEGRPVPEQFREPVDEVLRKVRLRLEED